MAGEGSPPPAARVPSKVHLRLWGRGPRALGGHCLCPVGSTGHPVLTRGGGALLSRYLPNPAVGTRTAKTRVPRAPAALITAEPPGQWPLVLERSALRGPAPWTWPGFPGLQRQEDGRWLRDSCTLPTPKHHPGRALALRRLRLHCRREAGVCPAPWPGSQAGRGGVSGQDGHLGTTPRPRGGGGGWHLRLLGLPPTPRWTSLLAGGGAEPRVPGGWGGAVRSPTRKNWIWTQT